MQRLTIVAFALLSWAEISRAATCGSTATLSCPSVGVAEALTSAGCKASDNSVYDLWQFSGTSGQSISIDMTSTAFDTYLILIDPSGTPVAENDDISASSTSSRIGFTLNATGTWTVVANSFAAMQSGNYTLSLACSGSSLPRRRAARHGSN